MKEPGDLGLLKDCDEEQIATIKLLCEQSQHYFTQFFFHALEGQKFLVGQHHALIDKTLDKVVAGDIKRLLVNEPPGFSKTLQCVHMFVARGFALNPRCRFLHVSFSTPLVLDNSAQVREIMSTVEYQRMWPRVLRKDTNAKNLWRTLEGGSFKATASGGTATGFRAGTMDNLEDDDDDISAISRATNREDLDEDDIEFDEMDLEGFDGFEWFGGFSGALIIDDPIKPDDALSSIKRGRVNDRYMNTLRSRLAHEKVPIVVIGQRLHPADFSFHLLSGGGGEKFHHLLLPVMIDNSKKYPSEYTHGIPIKHGLPDGPLWRAKMSESEINILRRDTKVFSAQYMQDPRLSTNATFKTTYFKDYEVRPRTINVAIIVDPSKGKSAINRKKSDRTAMAVIGIDAQGNKYLLDGYCHRMKLSERWAHLKRLYLRWVKAPGVQNVWVGYEEYGMQADIEHFEEKMQLDGPIFQIIPLNWAKEGGQSKEDRTERLEPDFKHGHFLLPTTVYYEPEGGECFWEGEERGVVFRKARGKAGRRTGPQIEAYEKGEGFRVAQTLLRKDENDELYDLSWLLMQELRDFPNAQFDDMGDACSRIYDLDVSLPVDRKGTLEAEAYNESLEF